MQVIQMETPYDITLTGVMEILAIQIMSIQVKQYQWNTLGWKMEPMI